jgi:hypothetical protein
MDDDFDDTVGYGNPPKGTQFKKGKSGNPKGRPPNKIWHQIVQDVLNEEVTITVNGEKKKMTKKEAAVQQLLNESMKGKSTATRNLLILMRTLASMAPL